MADTTNSSETHHRAVCGLLHPSRFIVDTNIQCSEYLKAENWSEVGLFLWLQERWLATSAISHGVESSHAASLKEKIRRLLGVWLTIASVDGRNPH